MIINYKLFKESKDDSFLDISKLKNVDVLEIGTDFIFYRVLDIEQTQELLKIWPDINLPIKHDSLLKCYFDAGFIFYFYVTKDKKDLLFFETVIGNDDVYELKTVMTGYYKPIDITTNTHAMDLIKIYCDTSKYEDVNSFKG